MMASRGWREGKTERCSMRRVSFGDERVLEVWYTLCEYFCNPMNCSPPNPLSMGMLQARILERVAMPSSRGSS